MKAALQVLECKILDTCKAHMQTHPHTLLLFWDFQLHRVSASRLSPKYGPLSKYRVNNTVWTGAAGRSAFQREHLTGFYPLPCTLDTCLIIWQSHRSSVISLQWRQLCIQTANALSQSLHLLFMGLVKPTNYNVSLLCFVSSDYLKLGSARWEAQDAHPLQSQREVEERLKVTWRTMVGFKSSPQDTSSWFPPVQETIYVHWECPVVSECC